ncbi:hypothetical protein [Frankia sp. Cj3]|uniref:hypothetical protein n=1 Tax=Frankia sp. Cj3 TaxID=2880976 RepID=UPI001EF60A42|nr:hypothetical protein [Frankia sp. Cj3]
MIIVDFSCDQYVVVGRVRARFGETHELGEVADLIGTQDLARLYRSQVPWVHEQVTVTRVEHELPLVSGGRRPRPVRLLGGVEQGLDEDALADMVAEALG